MFLYKHGLYLANDKTVWIFKGETASNRYTIYNKDSNEIKLVFRAGYSIHDYSWSLVKYLDPKDYPEYHL